MKLCENCQERPAAIFSTTVLNGVSRSSMLCRECYDATASAEERDSMARLKEAHCAYCGGQPCSGGGDPFSAMAGATQERLYLCVPCLSERHRLMLPLLRSVSPQEEPQAALREVHDKVENHMRQWGKDFGDQVRAARCGHCGGQPCLSGSDYFAIVANAPSTHFMCAPCWEEFGRFMAPEFERIPDEVTGAERRTMILALRDKAGRHLKEKASQRGGG